MLFLGDSEDHLHMFSVDDSDAETIGDCEIYPALDESLESLNVDDVTNVATVTTIDGSKESICNYEWADYIDDAINALHGGTDIPVAIQVTRNFVVVIVVVVVVVLVFCCGRKKNNKRIGNLW